MKFKYVSLVTAIVIAATSSSIFAKGGRDKDSSGKSGQSCNSGPAICGDGNCQLCCDCLGLEAIDVDSLTPAAVSKRLYESLQARLVFVVPEDADVYLSGQRMSTLGVERAYLVSVNDPERIYKYDIRVEVVRNGKKYFKQETLRILRAGAIIAIQVDAPPVPEGLPALIAFGIAPVMPGGPPADLEVEAPAIEEPAPAPPGLDPAAPVAPLQDEAAAPAAPASGA